MATQRQSFAQPEYDLPASVLEAQLDGSLQRRKARMLVDVWLDKVYGRIMDVDTKTTDLLDAGKALIDLGDLKPKQVQPQQGTGFSITINLPGGDTATISQEATTDTIDAPFVIIPSDPLADLPDAPAYITAAA
jgi:hypothetical protein